MPPACSEASWAHPRSRGENQRPASIRSRHGGSSPLTRGKLHLAATQRASRGLIPAHAGKTDTPFARAVTHAAHPRSRGENSKDGGFKWLASGSSPLTRGKPGHLQVLRKAPGLIPAHAGKTQLGRHVDSQVRAHPRSRGENAVAQVTGGSQPGSSPLTRGKPDQSLPRPHAPGLIPAHAGKTSVHAPTMRAHRAHPRSRGENRAVRALRGVDKGSSPLTRGKH